MSKRLADDRRADPYRVLPPAHHSPPPRAMTLGPEVGEVCRRAGYGPDPEQQLVLDDVFAYGPDGLPAAFEYGLVGPRQQLKTGTLIMCAIGWLFVVPDVKTITWSAHLRDTALKSFNELAAVIKGAPHLRRMLADDRAGGIHTGKDVEKVVTRDGRELTVSARTDRGGRGLTGDRLALDEALFLTPAMMGALLPTLTARRNAQALYASTPGLAGSVVLREKRNAGRAGNTLGLGWSEWGTKRPKCKYEACLHFPPGHPAHLTGCAMDDEDLWWGASPLLGRVRANGTGLSLVRMRQLRGSMPPSEFGREFLGWWDEPTDTDIFGDGAWSAATASYTDDGGEAHVGYPQPPDFELSCVGVAVSADLASASIVGAGVRGERTAVRLIATAPGHTWVVPRLMELQQDHPRLRFVVDLQGPSGVLTWELKERLKPARRVTAVNLPQWKAACAGMYTGVRDQTIEHGAQPELDDAVTNAKKRDIQDRWVFERYGYDASPLEAATLAAWGVVNTQKASAYEERGVLTV